MKRKHIFLILAILLVAIIVLGGTLTQDSKEVSGSDYDTAFYVDGSKNLFIMTAKMLDKFCYTIVDAVISSVGSVFNSILNN